MAATSGPLINKKKKTSVASNKIATEILKLLPGLTRFINGYIRGDIYIFLANSYEAK